ncbi:MAG: transglycosylase domain-containing protein, partial [Clostridia bacterium]|nr:transglycosylase domain-containing protein [Clostridia bacterium]
MPKKSIKNKKLGPFGTAFVSNLKPKTIVLSGVVAFVLAGIIVVGYVLSYMIGFANGDVEIDLKEYQVNQSQTSIIYAYDEEGNLFELQRLHGDQNRIYVGLDEIPDHLQNAFIALEDARFPTHKGVDWIRFVAVFVKDKLSTGGSSITQQLVKNITGDREPHFGRKFHEICNALNLEKNFDKDEILEAYLNTLYLGSGCYGVKTACEKYFGKDVSEINIAEAACIASITKAPYTYNPLVNPEENRDRQVNKCLKAMLD